MYMGIPRFQQSLSEEVSKVEERKNEEMQLALSTMKAEMQALIEKAYAERDEHLANYTRVCQYIPYHCIH